MTKPLVTEVRHVEQTEEQLIQRAKEVAQHEDNGKWELGKLATDWTRKFAHGRGDDAFAKLVGGYSQQQINYRRNVWGTFNETYNTYCNLRWSHFHIALNWDDAEEWLTLANDNRWSCEEMRAKRKSALPPVVVEAEPGTYRVIYADPPWKYNDALIETYGGADKHYPTMSLDELCAMNVSDLAASNSVLFIWTTSPMLEDTFPVIDSWGFKYKTSFVWDKVRHNFGHYNSVRHEFLLIATRGSCVPDSKDLRDSVVQLERNDKHSSKPAEFIELIESMYTRGPYIELFAREQRDGWSCWGNEV